MEMVVKLVTTPCLQWSQPSASQSPTSTMSTTKKRALNDVVLTYRLTWLGTTSSKLSRSRSFEFNPKQQQRPSHSSIRRACSASFDSFSDEEFSRKIQELAFRFQHSDDDTENDEKFTDSETESGSAINFEATESSMESDWPVSIEMKANSVDLPLSLRMMKRKKMQRQEGFMEAGESAYCSVKKAFSSMVFIIRELHSYTLQMREFLFYEDLKGILARVQCEMHTSFVWLFQQVFSHTPTLMVYVMILLANFTVHSLLNSAASAHAAAVTPSITATVEERESTTTNKFDSSAIKPFSLFSSGGGKTASVGGGNGGGSNTKAVVSGMDGDGSGNRAGNLYRPIVSESVSGRRGEEELGLWDSIIEEASRMQGKVRDEALDHETLLHFVAPVTAKIDGDYDYEEYFRTELLYQTVLAKEPNNVLLLTNYAQFLYLVAHEYDRAEEYFKRATKVEPKDAEAHNKYAYFLWKVRNDLWAAEETFLEAISADPTNSYYAANYAHFLWSTGGEDTCFPLSSPDDKTLDA